VVCWSYNDVVRDTVRVVTRQPYSTVAERGFACWLSARSSCTILPIYSLYDPAYHSELQKTTGLEDSFTILNYSGNSTPGTHTPSHHQHLHPCHPHASLHNLNLHTYYLEMYMSTYDNAISDDIPDKTPDEPHQ